MAVIRVKNHRVTKFLKKLKFLLLFKSIKMFVSDMAARSYKKRKFRKRMIKYIVANLVFVSIFFVIFLKFADISKEKIELYLPDEISKLGFLSENEKICKNLPRDNRVLVLCLSRPKSYRRRVAIRVTWARNLNQLHRNNRTFNYTVVFLVCWYFSFHMNWLNHNISKFC